MNESPGTHGFRGFFAAAGGIPASESRKTSLLNFEQNRAEFVKFD